MLKKFLILLVKQDTCSMLKMSVYNVPLLLSLKNLYEFYIIAGYIIKSFVFFMLISTKIDDGEFSSQE